MSKVFDLEERTFRFARDVRKFTRSITSTISNMEDSKQLIRSSGSVGANYIEANDALSKKDFIYRIKISRKEAKESVYWLRLLLSNTDELDNKPINDLIKEATEIKKIFSSILLKSK